MNSDKRNQEFLYEIGTLRYIQRIWVQFLNKDAANISDHIFRVIWIALMLAKAEGADENKVMKMALVHDIVESRTGDVHYLSRMYTKRNDDAAIQDMLAGTSLEAEYLELFHEYEDRQTLESKIVKDADNLEFEFELREHYVNGMKLKEDFEPSRERVSEMLFTETARRMWKEVQESNPHDWHLNGNNRFNNGDWKR